MSSALILGLVLTAVGDFEVRPRTIEWSQLDPDRFDRRWTLPESPRAGRDLLDEMRRLSRARFEIDLPGGPEQRCLGDLVRAAGRMHERERRIWFEELRERAPQLMADWSQELGQLLLDDRLHSRKWAPERDHPRDGLLTSNDWELNQPWNGVEVDVRFCQAATLVRADLATIKQVENDYRAYRDNIGSDYETIYPRRDRFFRGTCPRGRPFSTLAILFRCDLPFPFSGYECKLKILNRIDADGIVRTDIYSNSKDFYYLAGRDVFLPVRDSRGDQVAFLVVRHFGFDLRGVPDKPKHRLEGLRGSLGNLKRNAERLFRQGERPFGEPEDAITGFRLLGRK